MDQRAILSLHDFVLEIHLGVTQDERRNTQKVSLDVFVKFAEPPRACQSDEVSESLDYVSICQSLKSRAQNQEFKTIEHLAQELLDTLKQNNLMKFKGEVCIVVHKLNVAIESLRGGSRFELSCVL